MNSTRPERAECIMTEICNLMPLYTCLLDYNYDYVFNSRMSQQYTTKELYMSLHTWLLSANFADYNNFCEQEMFMKHCDTETILIEMPVEEEDKKSTCMIQ